MLVEVENLDDVPGRLTEFDETEQAVVMKQKGGARARYIGRGPCTAFRGVIGGDCRCTIYARRPRVCADFRPGSERCLEVRQEHGFVVEKHVS
jgi:Fe-S-cluster containining protein